MSRDVEQAREIARELGRLVNCYTRHEEEGAFLDELMHREHRTLQQCIGRLFAQFLCNMGEPGMARFTDPRNEALHKMGKIIADALDRECYRINGKVVLPFI